MSETDDRTVFVAILVDDETGSFQREVRLLADDPDEAEDFAHRYYRKAWERVERIEVA